MINPNNINFSIKELSMHGKLKLFYKNDITNESWKQWKKTEDCNENEIEISNLRTILPSEIILDIENENDINRIKELLEAFNTKYYVWKTGSRGYHIHLFYENIECYDKEVRKEIRKKIIKRFNTDITKASEETLIAQEYKPHFKTGNKKILKEYKKGLNKLETDFIKNIILELEQKKLQKNIDDIEFIDYVDNDPFFNYIKSHEVPDNTMRNSIVFKNIAIALVKSGLDNDSIKNIMIPIINNNFRGKTYSEFKGWIEKARKKEFNDYNIHELNNWGREFAQGTIFYEKNPYKKIIEIRTDIEISREESNDDYLLSQAIERYMDIENLARLFIKIQPLRYDENNIFWIWNHNKYCWEITNETDLLLLIQHNTTQKVNVINSKTANEVLRALQLEARYKKIFNTGKNYIQFKNKLYNLQSKSIIDADSNYFITNPIPWKLGSKKETPIIDKLFDEWVGVQHKKTLYEIIAYCIFSDYPLHKIFCFIGSGCNGKSSFLRLLKKFIGQKNITTTDLDSLSESRFESFSLYKKLICMLGETNFKVLEKTARIKQLTGQDLIRYELKGKSTFFSDYNYAKIIMATNSLPMTLDKTEGFYRRWIIIDFPHKFEDSGIDIIDSIPDEEFENLALKSIDVIEKLLEKGKFDNEGSVSDKMKKFEEKSNPFIKFIEEFCYKDINAEIPLYQLFDKYKEFLVSRGFRMISNVAFSNILKNEGFEIKRLHKRLPNGKEITWMYVFGLTLKDNSNLMTAEGSIINDNDIAIENQEKLIF